MKKEVLGQPAWLWAVGAVIVVGGYLYFKHQASSASSSASPQGQPAAAGKSSSTSSFKEWLVQHQGGPTSTPKPKPRKKKH